MQVRLHVDCKEDKLVWKLAHDGNLILIEAYKFKRIHLVKFTWARSI